MPAFGWHSKKSVKDWLFKEAFRFDFFQAVRLLELLRPGSEPLGEGSIPEKEAARFHSRVGLDFPASDIDDVRRSALDPTQVEMTVNFLGLSNAQSPMPHSFTEWIQARIHQKDFGMRDFLDIFNHRLISLMYRIRKVHRVGLTNQPPDASRAAGYLYSLMGLGLPRLRNRMQVRDRALLHYAGLLSQQPRSAHGLERILSDYLQMRVRVKQLAGVWRNIEPDQWTRLGRDGANRTLGADAVLGGRIWDQQGAFEIELGPVPYHRFLQLLGDGTAYPSLCELTRFYVGERFEFAFRLILQADQVPEARIGQSRLGWTSWLKTKPFQHDDSQVRLQPF